MLRERILGVFVLAAVGIALACWQRPDFSQQKGADDTIRNWFFIHKVHSAERHDVVVVGDSRALRGVAPGEMEPLLENRDVFNFAFHAGGMNREMYAAAEERVDPESPQPCILLAPTALSFMAWKEGNEQYRQYRAKPRDEVWLYEHARAAALWLRAIPVAAPLERMLREPRRVVLTEDFHADGWIATDQRPHDDVTDLELHLARLRGNSVETRLVNDFMEQTREWTAQGIRVASFWHPAYAPRVEMEERILGFDRAEFVARFEAAGGVWLDLEPAGYDSYDGSHLTRDSAERLSRNLAGALEEAL